MKIYTRMIHSFLLMAVSMTGYAQFDETALLIDKLGANSVEFRQEAFTAFVNQGLPALPVLLNQAGAENPTLGKWAARTAEDIIGRSTASEEGVQQAETELLKYILESHSNEQINAALGLLARVGSERSVKPVSIYLRNPETREKAIYALERVPSDAVEDLLIRLEKQTADASLKTKIVKTLGQRGNPISVDTVLNSLGSKDLTLRMTAIEALGHIPDMKSFNALKKLARSSYGSEKNAAVASMLVLAGRFVNQKEKTLAEDVYLAAATKTDVSHYRCAGLYGLVQLKGRGAWHVLLILLRDPDPEVRGTAKDLLIPMEGEDITQGLVRALNNISDVGLSDIIYTLGHRNDPTASTAVPALVSRLRAYPELEDLILDTLVRIPGSNATLEVHNLLSSAPAEIRSKLIQVLGDRNGQMASRDLLGYAQSSPDPVVRSSAIRALGKLKDIDSIPVISQALNSQDEPVVNAAAEAAVFLTEPMQLLGMRQEAIMLAMAASQKSTDMKTVRRLAGRLNALGAGDQLSEMARRFGFITEWYATGPFPNREYLRGNDVISFERPADPRKPFTVDGKSYQWQRVSMTDLNGMINIESIFGGQNNAGAYFYALVQSPKDQEAMLQIGSDDDIVVWLNETKVHEFLGDRGWNPFQDRVNVSLKRGTNRVLAKVLNAGGGWAFSVRVVDTNGNPLPIKQ